MRSALERPTVDGVNKAIRRHLAPTGLSVVMITKDAAGLQEKLVADGFAPIRYDAAKPEDVLAEDKVIGSLKLGIAPESVRITPAAAAYAE